MTHGSHSNDLTVLAPRSKFYHGPFGRICSDLSPWRPFGIPELAVNGHFLDMANNEMLEAPGLSPSEIVNDPAQIAKLENTFSSSIPAGYTYFGQFIDHDITFDPVSTLMRESDPNGLLNHRTPRMDLDNIYGTGPGASPHLYDNTDKDKFLIGNIENTTFPDLPRNSQGIALIGDPRNDENAMVSQLQLAFLLAHNNLVDRARDMGPAETAFDRARTTLRWLYQHIVWHDFVRRIANNRIHACALSQELTCDGRKTWELGLKDVYYWRNNPYMPVEFSVAAYRFGHSMVRNGYQTNQPIRGAGNFTPIFDNSAPDTNPVTGFKSDLRGFRPMVIENTIQWDFFFQMDSSSGPFPQRARKIDTKLSNALAFLHESQTMPEMNILAFRNLMRGYRLSLPSGTDVAKKFCIEPNFMIRPDHDALWYYILKEAESLPGVNQGQMLGRVGSTIVCAVFAGLLKGDPASYFNIDPCWTPDDDPLLEANDNVDSTDGSWTVGAIIRLSGLPVSESDFGSSSS